MTMFKHLKTLARTVVVAAGVATIAVPAVAQTQWCEGTINSYFLVNSGELAVLPSWRGDWLYICNTRVARTVGGQTIEPSVCSGWLSTIRHANVLSKSTVLRFNSPSVCSQMPTYGGTPTPDYVMILTY